MLVAVACLCALGTAVLALSHVLAARQMARLQFQVTMVNRYHMIAQSLANDAAEYGKRNPAINDILQSMSAPRPAAVQPIAPAPAAKPPGK